MSTPTSSADMVNLISCLEQSRDYKIKVLNFIISLHSVKFITDRSFIVKFSKYGIRNVFTRIFKDLYQADFKRFKVADIKKLRDAVKPLKAKGYYSNCEFRLKKELFCVIVGMHINQVVEVSSYDVYLELLRVGGNNYLNLKSNGM